MPKDQAIQRALALQNALLHSQRFGVAIFDPQLRCLAWNQSLAELSGIAAERVLRQPFSALRSCLGPRLGNVAPLEQALLGSITRTDPMLCGASDAAPRWLDISYEPLRDDDGNPCGALLIAQDVTAQIVDQETHRTDEQNFRNLAEQLPDGLAIFKGRETRFVNQHLVHLLGYEDPAELLDRALLETLFAPRDQAEFSALCQQLNADSDPLPPWKGRLLRRDGTACPVECRLSATVFDHHMAHLLIVRDLSARERTDAPPSSLSHERAQRAHLSAALEQVHGVSRKLIAAQEAQSRRLSRELHDDVGQLITALKLYLDRLQPAAIHEYERDTLGTARQIAVELVDRVRRLSMDLRPTVLDDLGLVPALRWQFERIEKLTGVRVQLQSRAIDRRFAEDLEIAIYRIVQEGLCNVIRHARVNEVTVRLWCDGLNLGAQIEDHGVGFVVDQQLSLGRGLGLSGMCERARQLDGECIIESTPGRGTRITIELPLAAAAIKESRPS